MWGVLRASSARAQSSPAEGPAWLMKPVPCNVDQIGRGVLIASSNQEPRASGGSFVIDHRGEAACVLRLSPAVGFGANRHVGQKPPPCSGQCILWLGGQGEHPSVKSGFPVIDHLLCRHACRPQGPCKWTVVSGNMNQKPGWMTVIGKAVNPILTCLLLKIRKFFFFMRKASVNWSQFFIVLN